jgi:transposase
MPFIAQLPPVVIGIEACGGAHYWARHFREQGHVGKLMAPQFVKPYVKSNTQDMADAEPSVKRLPDRRCASCR